MTAVPAGSPTPRAEILEELREEWEALGHMSYHGVGGPSQPAFWYADLERTDIEAIRALLNSAAAALLSEREAARDLAEAARNVYSALLDDEAFEGRTLSNRPAAVRLGAALSAFGASQAGEPG